jgi:hypothetical protein
VGYLESLGWFGQKLYGKRADWFWKLPRSWADPCEGSCVLADLWRQGRTAPATILPVLGQHAHSPGAANFRLSLTEIARTALCDWHTAAKGRDVLEARQLVRTWTEEYMDQEVTHWELRPALAAPRGSDEYFYCSSALLYGGQWGMMTGAQRQLYLALGANAYSSKDPPEAHKLVNAVLPDQVDRCDLERCHDETGRLRLVRLSHPQLARASGVGRQAIIDNVALWKHPAFWGEDGNPDGLSLRLAPIWVYPTRQHGLLYHFRDHVAPWPWDVLNAKARLSSPHGEQCGLAAWENANEPADDPAHGVGVADVVHGLGMTVIPATTCDSDEDDELPF